MRRADPAAVDDLLAEVFIVLWRRLEELPAEPLPWLFGVARRQPSTQRRGELRRAALKARLAHVAILAPTPTAATQGVLGGALERLSPSDRELLMPIAWEQLTPRQAAEALGISPAALCVRLHRARRRLAQVLEGEQPSCAPLSMEVSQ